MMNDPVDLDEFKQQVAEIEALVTDKGIWNDITTFFVFGLKNSFKGTATGNMMN